MCIYILKFHRIFMAEEQIKPNSKHKGQSVHYLYRLLLNMQNRGQLSQKCAGAGALGTGRRRPTSATTAATLRSSRRPATPGLRRTTNRSASTTSVLLSKTSTRRSPGSPDSASRPTPRKTTNRAGASTLWIPTDLRSSWSSTRSNTRVLRRAG